jgi:hypothetical protein
MESGNTQHRKQDSSVIATQEKTEIVILPPELVGTILVTIQENEIEFALMLAYERSRQSNGLT